MVASTSVTCRAGSPADAGATPLLVADVDLAEPLPELPRRAGSRRYVGAWALVRLHTEPIGTVRFRYDDRPTVETLGDAVVDELAPAILERTGCGREDLRELLGSGFEPTETTERYLAGRDAIVREGPSVSIVVCTRRRSAALAACLSAILRQDYPRLEVLVVDNTSGDPAVGSLVDGLESPVPLRWVVEPHVGLSRARNRGLAEAAGEIVAFVDDDAVPDVHWASELARGYTPDVAAVTGAILPAAIDTDAQEWFLRYGGHSKGRGWIGETFDGARKGAQSALYPLPPFGAGGNMSFRRDVLRAHGGFDLALGAGTPARGAEETALFTHVLLAGRQIAYRPSALVWHRDRERPELVREQLHALGTSLTAYYTSLLWTDPRLVVPLVRLLPQGLRDLRRQSPGDGSAPTSPIPASLRRAHRLGMLVGPWAYLRGRMAAA